MHLARPKHRNRRRATAAAAALVATGVLVAIPQAVAAAANTAVLPPATYTASGCAGQTPIVVGSDAKAQSDIYSAVTLAGVIGTECVVLAGPRDGAMPADQQARLNATTARGWVVGGSGAVPNAKIAGYSLSRIAGKDRWTTAQRVGTVARSLAGDGAPPTATLDFSLSAPGDVAQPGVHLSGAEPWIASECDGDVPIVVGSDAKAQSDIYSAVTLAGVIGTDCVVLAGPRDGEMPSSQNSRLNDAEEGGFVVGGKAAVPTAKIAGRDMTRLSGADRWKTAQLVGRRASGDTSAGTSTADESGSADESDTAGSAGGTSGVSAVLNCVHSPDFTQWDFTDPADGSRSTQSEGDFEPDDPSVPDFGRTIAYEGGADCTWTFNNTTSGDVRVRVVGIALYANNVYATGPLAGSRYGLLVRAGSTVTAFHDFAFEADGIDSSGNEFSLPDVDYQRWVADGTRIVAECGYWTDTDARDIVELGAQPAMLEHIAEALSDVEEGSDEYWARYPQAAADAKREVYWQYLTPCSGWTTTSDGGNVSVSAK